MKFRFATLFILALVVFSSATLWAQDESAGIETNAEDIISQKAGEMASDLKDAGQDIMKGDFTSTWDLAKEYLWPVAQALLILIVAFFLGKFLARVTRIPIEKHVDMTLGRFVGKLVFYAIMIFAALGVLGKFGVSVASFAAVIAAAGFAIGLAFQGTLSNFSSGILLLVFRPYKVGDVINAAGITAKVSEIELFNTVLDTFDNRRIIVPNNKIASDTIENITFHGERRVDVPVGVDYGADLEKTRDVLTAAAESLGDQVVQGEGRGHTVLLDGLGDSAVNWKVMAWAKSADFLAVKQALTAAVKNHLDAAGIGIPFPQMDVHLDKEE